MNATTNTVTSAGYQAHFNPHRRIVELKVLMGRNLRKITRVPQLMFFSLIQPVLFMVLFSQVFKSIALTPGFPMGVPYIDYLVPAVLVTTVATNSTQSGVGIATDLITGVLDRFRSLPIGRSAVILARSLSDLVRSTVQVLIMLIIAVVIFGYSPGDSVTRALLAVALVITFAWAMSWIFIAIGISSKNAEAAQFGGFLFIFPLMFASSAYVPVKSLPGWLQAIAKVNPLSYVIDAARALLLGWPARTDVLEALAAIVIVAVVGLAASIRAWRRVC
jgi:ABC-2 type transport system permease protein